MCVICKQSLSDNQDTVILREKGALGVNKASVARADEIYVLSGMTVHKECRCIYVITIVIQRKMMRNRLPAIYSALKGRHSTFKNTACFVVSLLFFLKKKRCNEDVIVFPVKTSDFKETIRRTCLDRDDNWGQEVHSRIQLYKSCIQLIMCTIGYAAHISELEKVYQNLIRMTTTCM